MHNPRPILKRPHPDPGPHHGPHYAVHFPPSPSLTTHTFSVYSAAAYDRSPIIVSPNSCALPERGGRTYSLDDDPASSLTRSHYGDLHPRAFPAASRSIYPSPGSAHPPPLVPDLSSESEESDGVASPHLDSTHVPPSSHLHGLAIPQDKYKSFDSSYATSSSALSFLPHPPSPPSRSSYPYRPSSDDDPKSRRPRERKYEGSYDLGRIPSAAADGQQVMMSRKKKSRVCNSLSVCNLTSSFRVEDDGCLGGF
jgi:hypothetical protein